MPAATASAFSDRFRAGLTADEEALEKARDGAQVLAKTAGDGDGDGTEDGGDEGGSAKAKRRRGAGLEIDPLERQDRVEAGFADAVASLGKLKREMPATVAKMERARVAGEYVVTER